MGRPRPIGEELQLIKDYTPGLSSNRPRLRLTGAKQWMVVLLLLIAVSALYVGLYPWSFFMGGSFHPLGYWRGWGRMHSNTAKDYLLYVEISPFTRRTSSIVPSTHVRGRANLCTSKGQRFYLTMGGDMPPHVAINTVGLPIHLYMSNWHESFNGQSRPHVEIWGRWGKGEIVGDDRKTLSQSFLPDGTVIPQGKYAAPSQMEDIQVTLREGTFSEWEAACSHQQH